MVNWKQKVITSKKWGKGKQRLPGDGNGLPRILSRTYLLSFFSKNFFQRVSFFEASRTYKIMHKLVANLSLSLLGKFNIQTQRKCNSGPQHSSTNNIYTYNHSSRSSSDGGGNINIKNKYWFSQSYEIIVFGRQMNEKCVRTVEWKNYIFIFIIGNQQKI